MSDIKIIIKNSDYEAILAHCKKNLPEEACGLLAGTVEGDTKTVAKVYLLENTDHSNEHFTISPKDQFACLKDARANGLTILGNFHSHPKSPSRPSEEDKRLANDTNAEYLILSLMEPENPVFKAFGVDQEKQVTIHEISYVDE